MSVAVSFEEAVASVEEGIDPPYRPLVDIDAVVRDVFTQTPDGWVRSGGDAALILSTARHARPALERDGLYLSGNGRLVCGRATCAGGAAMATGVDLHGCPVTTVTPAAARELARLGVHVLICECGEVSREAGQVRA